MWWFAVIWLGALGGCVGSFLTVVWDRLGTGEGFVFPRSRCPECDHEIRWYHNLPIVGWLLLAGPVLRLRLANSGQAPAHRSSVRARVHSDWAGDAVAVAVLNRNVRCNFIEAWPSSPFTAPPNRHRLEVPARSGRGAGARRLRPVPGAQAAARAELAADAVRREIARRRRAHARPPRSHRLPAADRDAKASTVRSSAPRPPISSRKSSCSIRPTARSWMPNTPTARASRNTSRRCRCTTTATCSKRSSCFEDVTAERMVLAGRADLDALPRRRPPARLEHDRSRNPRPHAAAADSVLRRRRPLRRAALSRSRAAARVRLSRSAKAPTAIAIIRPSRFSTRWPKSFTARSSAAA